MAICLRLPTLFRLPPYHLAHHELSHIVVSVPFFVLDVVGAERGKEDREREEENPGENYEHVLPGKDVYLRIWFDPNQKQYSVSMTYSPWPAFAVDPVRFGEWHSNLQDALRRRHRIYPWYRHESVRPIPYFSSYHEYQLSDPIIDILVKEFAFCGGLDVHKN